jgi:hypothetical protein
MEVIAKMKKSFMNLDYQHHAIVLNIIAAGYKLSLMT